MLQNADNSKNYTLSAQGDTRKKNRKRGTPDGTERRGAFRRRL